MASVAAPKAAEATRPFRALVEVKKEVILVGVGIPE
jgi:hypothetical protein